MPSVSAQKLIMRCRVYDFLNDQGSASNRSSYQMASSVFAEIRSEDDTDGISTVGFDLDKQSACFTMSALCKLNAVEGKLNRFAHDE